MSYSARLFKDENGRTKFQIVKNESKINVARNEANGEIVAPAKPFKKSIVAFVLGLLAMVYAIARLCYIIYLFIRGYSVIVGSLDFGEVLNIFNILSLVLLIASIIGSGEILNILFWVLGIAAIIIGSNERHRHKDEEVKLAILGIKYGKVFVFLRLAPWIFSLLAVAFNFLKALIIP